MLGAGSSVLVAPRSCSSFVAPRSSLYTASDMPHRLLLADDSVTIQKVIELTFSDEDFEVVTVGVQSD